MKADGLAIATALDKPKYPQGLAPRIKTFTAFAATGSGNKIVSSKLGSGLESFRQPTLSSKCPPPKGGEGWGGGLEIGGRLLLLEWLGGWGGVDYSNMSKLEHKCKKHTTYLSLVRIKMHNHVLVYTLVAHTSL